MRFSTMPSTEAGNFKTSHDVQIHHNLSGVTKNGVNISALWY